MICGPPVKLISAKFVLRSLAHYDQIVRPVYSVKNNSSQDRLDLLI